MIVFVTMLSCFFAFVCFLYFAHSNFNGISSLVGMIMFLSILCLSHLMFWTSKYPEPTETIYPINIAPNHIAYICKDSEIINISCKIQQNLTEKDKYVETVYPGYWAGFIYVEKKVKFKLLRDISELEA